MFHPAPTPSQQDIERLALRVSNRILRFLQRRRVITLVTAPGDGEVTVVPDETMGESDPLLAHLLAAATAGAAPAGPASKRQPIRIVLHPADDSPRRRRPPSVVSPGFQAEDAQDDGQWKKRLGAGDGAKDPSFGEAFGEALPGETEPGSAKQGGQEPNNSGERSGPLLPTYAGIAGVLLLLSNGSVVTTGRRPRRRQLKR